VLKKPGNDVGRGIKQEPSDVNITRSRQLTHTWLPIAVAILEGVVKPDEISNYKSSSGKKI
jgi:hypothetical protein